MRLAADARVLGSLLRGMGRAGMSHGESLQRFYAPQAAHYDGFRERLLKGRAELISQLACAPGARIVELGAGTGRNLEFFGERLRDAACVDLVDLCPALLDIARARHAARANVRVTLADATSFQPGRPADCVYFSYSLSMIPDWRAALDNAIAMLAPGGILGVVDFHVPNRLSPLARAFWPWWFRHDGVRLSREHLPYLLDRLTPIALREASARVPYLPGLAAPYYVLVARKAGGPVAPS